MAMPFGALSFTSLTPAGDELGLEHLTVRRELRDVAVVVEIGRLAVDVGDEVAIVRLVVEHAFGGSDPLGVAHHRSGAGLLGRLGGRRSGGRRRGRRSGGHRDRRERFQRE